MAVESDSLGHGWTFPMSSLTHENNIRIAPTHLPDCAPLAITDSVLVSKISRQFSPTSRGRRYREAARRVGGRNFHEVS